MKPYTGFPNPGIAYKENPLNLNNKLIKHPAATFFVRCKTNSLRSSGIYKNDLLIVDRALDPVNKAVVVIHQGEFALRKLTKRGLKFYLTGDGAPVIELVDGGETEIWGTIAYSIHDPNYSIS